MSRTYNRNPFLQELDKMSDREIYEEGKRRRDALKKRLRRLEENMRNNPGDYSPHGYKVLAAVEFDDQGNEVSTSSDGRDGIPMISTKMNRQELKTNAMMLENLMQYKTTTSRGASKHQRETIMNIVGVDPDKRMNTEERLEFDDFQDFVRRDPNAMNLHWQAFDVYKDEETYRNLDSETLLNEFREIFKNLRAYGLGPQDYFDKVREISQRRYEKRAQDSLMDDLGRGAGMI